jgi:hypothetical protein
VHLRKGISGIAVLLSAKKEKKSLLWPISRDTERTGWFEGILCIIIIVVM